jgi:hypothetical protein
MPTKSHTLIPYHLRDHNIQSWRKGFFLPLPKGDSSLLGSKKTTLSSRFRIYLFRFLFLGELGTCPQNLMPTWGVEPWENHKFPLGGMLKFTYEKPFFDNKNSIWKILGLKIQTVETCSSASSIHRSFRLWADFGRFWAVLGRFCCIDSGLQHALTWAEILKTS